MASFEVLTYNCKGLGQKNKRQRVFNYLNDKVKNGVVLLQETHSTPECVTQWEKEWGGKMFFSHGTSNSTGTAICFSKKIQYGLDKSFQVHQRACYYR